MVLNVTHLHGHQILIKLVVLIVLFLSFSGCSSEESKLQKEQSKILLQKYQTRVEKITINAKQLQERIYELQKKNMSTIDPQLKGRYVTEMKKYADRIKKDKEILEDLKTKIIRLQNQ